MEFHIARGFRDKFDLRDLLFSYTGNVIFGNVAASRRLAQQMNDARIATGGPTPQEDPKSVVHAGQLFAMGLIDELSHAVIEHYRLEHDPAVLADALKWFGKRVGEKKVDALLLAFTERFPNIAVYQNKITAAKWLAGSTEGRPHREVALEELLLLWLANQNPAYRPFRTLFDDTSLRRDAPIYIEFQSDIEAYFETRPEFGDEARTLLKALRLPFEEAPDSLSKQLDYIRDKWMPKLGTGARATLSRTLLAIDTLREEEVAIWMQFNPPGRNVRQHGSVEYGGKEGFVGDEYVGFEEYWEDFTDEDGTVTRRRRFRTRSGALVEGAVPHDYQAPLNEYEAFSHDDAWMPNVVLMAKSTYVWLEQLSKKYRRHIHRLDQIPLEELQLLRDRGMTGLWLIGLWERSRASQTIKRLRGQEDAVASAYSLMDYTIAEDLGGDSAYAKLRDLAATVGLRLASDMVPNHMGLDSTWVIEHPEWFIRRSESPYPNYSFEGPDLSTDPRVEIKLEDHYFDQTDAAVVYRMRYRDGSNRTEFLYHGNDGTTFAWNDTAQLDYSKQNVREHVIQVILDVARRFPIIRFDAAMVLAKRHVQRLWFPLPGQGGSIPSRAEDAMTQEEFDAIMPQEFWREVVDRVQAEVPGTLLLAEAFWLLEGYFVRTLGMHRVYNSAFMVMLRDEENAKYRSYLKKTIEFDPDIMKRYVNFMSNPDEKTAIGQFETGDKFFGVSTMMATIPGLPMFAHGQIEGYTEKYGMEYKQAKFDEWPNEELVARHMKEIAPLLKNRALFAESEHFVFFDFWLDNGSVDENVFAYSNRLGNERALIAYNNTIQSTRGTIHVSAASMNKWTGDLWQRSLADALALPRGDDFFLAWRDTASGLEYIRRSNDLVNGGLTLDLRGYQYAVLLDWRELRESASQPWGQLCDSLGGAGVHSLDEALTHLRLRPLTGALRYAVGAEAVRMIAPRGQQPLAETRATQQWGERAKSVFDRLREIEPAAPATAATSTSYAAVLTTLADEAVKAVAAAKAAHALPPRMSIEAHPEALWTPLLTVAALRALPSPVITAPEDNNIVDRLGLRPSLAEIFSEVGVQGEDAWRAAARVRLALAQPKLDTAAFWAEGDVTWLAGVNEHEGTRYINHEALEQLLQWLTLTAALQPAGATPVSIPAAQVLKAAADAGYQYDTMVTALTAESEAAAKQSAATKTPATKTAAKSAPAKATAAKTTAAKATATKTPATRTEVATEPTPTKAAAKSTAVKAAPAKTAAKKAATKTPAKKAAAKKSTSSPATSKSTSVLEAHAADGHTVIDTASIPDINAAGKKAAAKKSAKKTTAPKL
ncbi:membrane protein involved in colicin uptake [Terriglobus roseus DSM 18391]|uniref:Membrane protein involved in colicin uptake n=1 Tax=Terriglobus roseus (strain DSM 18391 / NRRL B-41598 / KBS 63) TaxID=926566 RepID=I3ZCR2_TERRK|nr:alpha-amylase family glycosyl hydrolase [Terriglobus roseus]AFL87030.1 membrane protein involved in colicin uptake [Terriglobus roseus DSM 18391]